MICPNSFCYLLEGTHEEVVAVKNKETGISIKIFVKPNALEEGAWYEGTITETHLARKEYEDSPDTLDAFFEFLRNCVYREPDHLAATHFYDGDKLLLSLSGYPHHHFGHFLHKSCSSSSSEPLPPPSSPPMLTVPVEETNLAPGAEEIMSNTETFSAFVNEYQVVAVKNKGTSISIKIFTQPTPSSEATCYEEPCIEAPFIKDAIHIDLDSFFRFLKNCLCKTSDHKAEIIDNNNGCLFLTLSYLRMQISFVLSKSDQSSVARPPPTLTAPVEETNLARLTPDVRGWRRWVLA